MQFKQELHNLQKNKMNINDYSIKVKNLVNALASIKAPVDDEDLVVVTLNGLGKNYSQFRTSIIVRETFPNFQDLITLLISEEMRIVGTSNGGSQESAFYSNTNRSRGRGGKTSFRGRHGSSHGGHHQHKVKLMEVDEETLEEEEVEEVVEVVVVVVDIIEVNN